MKLRFSRFLGTVICLVLVACLIPAAVSAAEPVKLGTPTDVRCNTAVTGYAGPLIDKIGSVSWRHTGPVDTRSHTMFEITVYRNNARHAVFRSEVRSDYLATGNYVSVDLSNQVDWQTGTYYLTVQYLPINDPFTSGDIVTSDSWDYVKPSKKLSTPQNLRFRWPNIEWDEVDGDCTYEMQCYFVPTKDADPTWTHHQWNINGNSSIIPDYIQQNGFGYYRFRVRAVSSNIAVVYNSGWSDWATYQLKMDVPAVKISGVASSGKPKISWNAVPHAIEYQIYRSTSKSSGYEYLKTTPSTSFTDTTAKAGKTYYYKVRSVSGDGIKSDFSAPVSRCCDLRQPVVTAKNVSSSGKIKLTWEKVSGAEKYMVYRKSSASGSYTRIATTTSTSHTDSSAKAGTKYYYKVMAVHDNTSANSAKSETVSCTCRLARPTVTVKLSKGDPRLSWKKVSDARKYFVYRATSKSGTYTRIKSTTKTAFTDTTAKAGKTYYYKVKAIHSNTAANSVYSAVDSIRAK